MNGKKAKALRRLAREQTPDAPAQVIDRRTGRQRVVPPEVRRAQTEQAQRKHYKGLKQVAVRMSREQAQ